MVGSRNFNLVGLQNRVAKKCKIFASELGSKSGVMRGFQKGITLDGRTFETVNLVSLQNRVAKKFANFFCIRVGI